MWFVLLTFRVVSVVYVLGDLLLMFQVDCFFDVLSGLCSLTFVMVRFVDVSGDSCC